MSNLRSSVLKTVIVLNLLFLFGCTYNKSYTPKFNAKKDSVINAIKTTYGFENITFIGKKQSGSGGEHSSVIVKFINGKKIPTDSTKMYDLEKQLGTQVKSILKTPDEFETYTIIFDSVVTDKGQFSDVTHENYTGQKFNYSEL